MTHVITQNCCNDANCVAVCPVNCIHPTPAEAAFNGAMKAGQRVVVNDAVAHLKEAIVLGRIPDRDPEVLAHAILGVANHLTRVFIGSRGQEPEAVADMVVTFCMEGIGAGR